MFSPNAFSRLALVSLISLVSTISAFADEGSPWNKTGPISTEVPREFKDVGITEKNGGAIDPHLLFTDDRGQKVELGSFFNHNKPLILSMVYLTCPNLCGMHLNGLTEGLKNLAWTVGDNFDVLTVSFDPKETTQAAADKKANYLKAYGRTGRAGETSAKGWHFLTGDESQIKKLAEEIGFKYKWDEDSKQFIHSTAAVIVTPDGKISRYLHGISFDPKTIRLSLVEASNGVIGDILDHVVLFCYHYNPAKRTYAFYAYNVLRFGAAFCALILGVVMFPTWKKMAREISKKN